MRKRRLRAADCAVMLATLLAILLGWCGYGVAAPPQTAQSRVEGALANIAALERPGDDGLATVWDGNKYVQCRRMPDHVLRCEAGGALMQPSLSHVLTPERIAQLDMQGWRLDASFGNYVQAFPADFTASKIAEKILSALADGYDADLTHVEVATDWIASRPCPTRNGPSQNLAGAINEFARAVYGGDGDTRLRLCAASFSRDPHRGGPDRFVRRANDGRSSTAEGQPRSRSLCRPGDRHWVRAMRAGNIVRRDLLRGAIGR